VYHIATEGTSICRMRVAGGPTILQLADAFEQLIREAIAAGDFTSLLTPDRRFEIVDRTRPDNVLSVISMGEGVEREVLQVLLQKYRAQDARWFYSRADSFSHFSSYHANQVAILLDHDEAAHNAMAADMLYHGIMGEAAVEHPEIQAFIKGFSLPCRNGFSFLQLSRHLHIITPSPLLAINSRLHSIFGDATINCKSHFSSLNT
ncbi:hypothetical protein B0H21DRAFT_714417, partial [Amylocystis lapponica]